MIEIKVNIDPIELERLVVNELKHNYETLLSEPPLGLGVEWDELEVAEAYKIVLRDFMYVGDFQKYMHELAKKSRKYDSKRLTDAEPGL